MTVRSKWLAARKSGIGGSDVAALVGADPKRGPLDVYLDKVGEVPEQEDSADLERGRMLEPLVARKYAKATGRRLTVVKDVLRDVASPCLLGTIDRSFVQGEAKGILEIKTMRVPVFVQAQRDGLPARFVTQLQHYLGITGLVLGSYAAFSMEYWALIHFDVEADPILQALLREAALTFWNDHVVPRKPPASDGWSIPVAVQKSGAEVRTLADSPEVRAAIVAYAEARDLAVTGEELKKQARTQLIELLGENRGAFRVGNDVLHYAERDGRVTFDKKALAAAQPIDRQKLLTLAASIWGDASDLVTQINAVLTNDPCTLDLALFDKRGKPYDELRLYLRGDSEEKAS